MSSADVFFSSPAVNPVQICRQMLSIYFSNWFTFMSISGIQLAFQVALFFFVFAYVLCFVMTGGYSEYTPSDIQDSEYYGSSMAFSYGGRRLIDGDVNYNSDDGNYDCDTGNLLLDLGPLLLPFLAGCIIFGVPAIVVISALHGATVRAAAETCAGLDPVNQLCSCLKDGWRLKWRITFVYLVLAVPIFVSDSVVHIVVPRMLCSSGFAQLLNSWWISMLKSIVFLLIQALTRTAIAASTSMIVVERMPAIDAVRSSWYLCSSSFGFVFGSLFSYLILKSAVLMCSWLLISSSGELLLSLLIRPLDDM